MIDAAIEIILGYTQPDHEVLDAGCWQIRRALRQRYPDANTHWVGVRVWNANEQIRADVRMMKESAARKRILIVYSWGAGNGSVVACKEAERIGLEFDVVYYIDPVVFLVNRFISRYLAACLPTDSPFTVPKVVRKCELFRTLNWEGPTCPYGRTIDDERLQHRIIFGRDLANFVGMDSELIRDGGVTHSTIDNDPRVRERILHSMETELWV